MKIKLEKTGAFWMYILGGIVAIVVGVMLLPVWAETNVFFNTWGALSVNIVISVLILTYILMYLLKRVNRYSGTPAQIVAIVELVLMAVIAVVCTASAFVSEVTFGGPSQIFGIALWVRGVSGVFTGYYCDSSFVKKAEMERKARNKRSQLQLVSKDFSDDCELPAGRVDDFTVWRLVFAVFLISFGTYLFFEPAFESIDLQWVFSSILALVGVFFVIFGFALKPIKVRIAKTSPKKEDEKQDGNEQEAGETEEEPKAPMLDHGKVNIKLDSSANAMTSTAAYDAVKDELPIEE